MAASVQFRPHQRDLGMVMREVDENLAIFLGIKNIESKGFDEPKSERIDNYFLDSEIDTNGCDWLIGQPVNDSAKNPTELSCRKADNLDARISEQLPTNTGESAKNSVAVAKRRPLSLSSSLGERKPTPRAPTPTGQRPVKPKASSRASTPTPARAAFPSSKTISASSTKPRSSTPTQKLTDTHTKPGAFDSKKPGLTASRGPFQTVKSRPSKTSETQINKTTLSSRRPASASRGRPSGARTSSTVCKPRQRSCSPAKTRAPNGNAVAKDGNIVMPKVRGCSNVSGGDDDGDYVNPVAMGTKMVERVVNMRKLVPPKQDNGLINDKKSGFGRSLSKKSLDMAIRHMGIKGSIHDGLSPVTTTGSSSSSRCSHSCSSKNSEVGVPESPIASSSDSSKSSNWSELVFS